MANINLPAWWTGEQYMMKAYACIYLGLAQLDREQNPVRLASSASLTIDIYLDVDGYIAFLRHEADRLQIDLVNYYNLLNNTTLQNEVEVRAALPPGSRPRPTRCAGSCSSGSTPV